MISNSEVPFPKLNAAGLAPIRRSLSLPTSVEFHGKVSGGSGASQSKTGYAEVPPADARPDTAARTAIWVTDSPEEQFRAQIEVSLLQSG